MSKMKKTKIRLSSLMKVLQSKQWFSLLKASTIARLESIIVSAKTNNIHKAYPKAHSKILSNTKDKEEEKSVSRAKLFLEQA